MPFVAAVTRALEFAIANIGFSCLPLVDSSIWGTEARSPPMLSIWDGLTYFGLRNRFAFVSSRLLLFGSLRREIEEEEEPGEILLVTSVN